MQCNNTQVDYAYRDANNYKMYNTVVLEGNLTYEQIEFILSTRRDDEFFIPAQVGLPEKRFPDYDPNADHPWFVLPDEAFSPTNQKATHSITAAELFEKFKKVGGAWIET